MNINLQLQILLALRNVPGDYLLPERTLLSDVGLAIGNPPSVADFQAACTDLETAGHIIRQDVETVKKYALSPLGTARLARAGL